jgi:hypothetical protein
MELKRERSLKWDQPSWAVVAEGKTILLKAVA